MNLKTWLKEHNKDYKYVHEYTRITDFDHEGTDTIFSGTFRIENGEIISLDGDSYGLDYEYLVIREEEARKDFVVDENISVHKGETILYVEDDGRDYLYRKLYEKEQSNRVDMDRSVLKVIELIDEKIKDLENTDNNEQIKGLEVAKSIIKKEFSETQQRCKKRMLE